MSYLDSIHIEPTGKCNLKCKYCYNSKYQSKKQVENELTFFEIKNIIDQAFEIGCRDFAISGGEPLVYSKIFELIDYISNKKVNRIAVFTNAMLLNEKNCEKFSHISPKIEFRITFDGYEKADVVRVGSNYRTILNSIKLLKKYGFHIVINTIVNELNYEYLDQIFIELSEIKVDKWIIDFPFRSGRAKEYIETGISAEEIIDAVCSIIEKYVKQRPPFSFEVQNLFKSQMLKEGFYKFDVNCGTCSYIKNGVTIRPNGDVLICPTLEISCGNVKDKSLKEIIDGKLRKELLNIKVCQISKCCKCKYNTICGGGCRADALNETGSIYNNDVVACFHMTIMEEKILPLLPLKLKKMIEKEIKDDNFEK